ncbi:MAG: alpha/beta fold hydrolase [Clostridia bacterium]|nr:alpha/beta fold hydrolase [Clostridia bacterium]
MVSLNEYRFLSSNGRDEIRVYEWRPETEPVAVLQLHHGVSEHIMRYNDFARFLASKGVFVVGHDCAGHGHSAQEGTRLNFGNGGWNVVVEDFKTIYDRYSTLYAGKPYFALGHSMGSFVLRTFISRFPGKLTGTILSGTGFKDSAITSAGKMVANAVCAIKGELHVSNLVNGLALGAYNNGLGEKGGYDWLSCNKESNDKYIADPWCGGIPTVGLYRDMFTGLAEVCSKDCADKMDKETPVLLISGAADPVGDKGEGVYKVANLFKESGVKNVKTLLYPSMRHEVLNEKNKQEAYDMVLRFVLGK